MWLLTQTGPQRKAALRFIFTKSLFARLQTQPFFPRLKSCGSAAGRSIHHLGLHGRVCARGSRTTQSKGRRATTHSAYTGLLALVGATYEKARIMKDGNVVTAGGVASGIDFALHIAAEIVGEETAQAIQLSIEYDPAPLFTSGHPDRAPASVTALVAPLYARAVLQPAALFRMGAHANQWIETARSSSRLLGARQWLGRLPRAAARQLPVIGDFSRRVCRSAGAPHACVRPRL